MEKGISKKATASASGLAIIAAQDDFKLQLILAVVLIVYLAAQTFLDYRGRSKDVPGG